MSNGRKARQALPISWVLQRRLKTNTKRRIGWSNWPTDTKWRQAHHNMRLVHFFTTALAMLATYAAAAPLEFGDGPRMNQIQVLGTHNSYHKRGPDLHAFTAITKEAEGWDYEHLPLDVQLANGLRSFELDIHNTPEGWRVMHVPILDATSTCPVFTDCLRLVKTWSDAHPGHVPISFLVEWKEEGPMIDPRITVPTGADMDRLDADVRSVYGPERLITPDDVRGDAATLEEAVLKRGWPTLESARGRVFFILHNRSEARGLYLEGRESLQGRTMFVNCDPGHPYAAAMVRDNPNDPETPDLVRKGYWVRCTVGGPDKRGLQAAKVRLGRSLACGAQIVSTDSPPGEPHKETGFMVMLPNGLPARWNPVNPPADTSNEPEAAE